MAARFHRPRIASVVAALAVVAVVVAVPAATGEEPSKISDAYLSHLSGTVAVAYWTAHQDQAPTRVQPFVKVANERDRTTPRSRQYCQSNANKDVFNCD